MSTEDQQYRIQENSTANTMYVGDDTTKLMAKVYLNVVFNWPTICQNQQIMTALDMDTNAMCRYHKSQNPSLRDSYIQAHVLSLLLVLWIIIATPIQSVFTESLTGVSELSRNVDTQFTTSDAMHSNLDTSSVTVQHSTQNHLDVD